VCLPPDAVQDTKKKQARKRKSKAASPESERRAVQRSRVWLCEGIPMSGIRDLVTWLSRWLFTILLAVAFLLASFLLVWHAFTAPKFEYGVAGELLLVAVLSLEGIVLQEYRSAEMMLAVNLLWAFRRQHGDDFVQAYLARWRDDDARIAKLPPEEQLNALHVTLHYRRRLVKEFFHLLAGLYELGMLPTAVLYTYWNEAELKIIPEILIPLETAVAREMRMEKELGDWHRRLQRLYDERPSGPGRITER
jgi:hypothetical protein